MSKSSRDKGQRGEREIVAIFAEHGFDLRRLYADPDQNSRQPDLTGLDGWGVEVKRRERMEFGRWWRQAVVQAKDARPLLLHRASRQPWIASLELTDFLDVLRTHTDEHARQRPP